MFRNYHFWMIQKQPVFIYEKRVVVQNFTEIRAS